MSGMPEKADSEHEDDFFGYPEPVTEDDWDAFRDLQYEKACQQRDRYKAALWSGLGEIEAEASDYRWHPDRRSGLRQAASILRRLMHENGSPTNEAPGLSREGLTDQT
jgi:hypothetical protein